MLSVVLRRRVLPTVIAMVVSAAALVIAGRAISAPTGAQKLPDLVQVTPTDLVITRSGSGARGVLRARLPLRGQQRRRRPADHRGPPAGAGQRRRWSPTRSSSATARRPRSSPDAGELRYVVSPDHRHWHYLGFDRYELRRAGQLVAAVRDQKTGFCLGDRYAAAERPASARAEPRLHEPVRPRRAAAPRRRGGDLGRLRRRLQGQPRGPVPAPDGLPAGRYVLVHQVNADRRLHELDYANNAASRPAGAALAAAASRWSGSSGSARTPTAATGAPVTATRRRPWPPASRSHGRSRSCPTAERWSRSVRAASGSWDPTAGCSAQPVARVAVSSQGEGGLLGLAVDPDFAHNHFVYLYYTTAGGMRLERWRFSNGRLRRERSLVDGIAAGRIHDSGRIAFGPDGRLYVATGDAGQRRRWPRGPTPSTASSWRCRPSSIAARAGARRSSPSATATRRASTGSPARAA